MSKTRIIVADDHDVVRKGLTFLLERINQTEVVGEAKDGHQAVELAEKLTPAVVIVRSLGGHFKICSRLGEGTHICVTVPVSGRESLCQPLKESKG